MNIFRGLFKSSTIRRYFSAKTSKTEKMPVNTLKEFGYGFNALGQLRKLDKNGHPGEDPFQFNISTAHQECQEHYEELGDAVTNHVYSLLETEESLIKIPVPKGSSDGTFVFASKDYNEKDVLLVLIHGSGAVRAGQWARSLIINDNLETGSQIPYIRKAVERGFGVIILNTNDNYTPDGKKIPQSGNPEEHGLYVWNTYISQAIATSIVIIAHSYGGVVTISLADKLKDEFDSRVKAVAFTDSVHSYSNVKVSNYMKRIAKNWISSSDPLDTPVKTPEFDISRVSAGHPKHEMTSSACIESVFQFIDEKLSNK